MTDTLMAFAFLGIMTCAAFLLCVGVVELWRGSRRPVAQPDYHAKLMAKYDCLMSDADCADMHASRWAGD